MTVYRNSQQTKPTPRSQGMEAKTKNDLYDCTHNAIIPLKRT